MNSKIRDMNMADIDKLLESAKEDPYLKEPHITQIDKDDAYAIWNMYELGRRDKAFERVAMIRAEGKQTEED